MKSLFIRHLILGVIFAAIAFFLLPIIVTSLAPTWPIALGIVFGATIVPKLAELWGNSDTTKANADDTHTPETTTLYIGNLAYRANEHMVKEHFSGVGYVKSVRLMKDKRTGKRKGYGFVEIATTAADNAIKQFNDSEFLERTLKVRLAKEKSQEF